MRLTKHNTTTVIFCRLVIGCDGGGEPAAVGTAFIRCCCELWSLLGADDGSAFIICNTLLTVRLASRICAGITPTGHGRYYHGCMSSPQRSSVIVITPKIRARTTPRNQVPTSNWQLTDDRYNFRRHHVASFECRRRKYCKM